MNDSDCIWIILPSGLRNCNEEIKITIRSTGEKQWTELCTFFSNFGVLQVLEFLLSISVTTSAYLLNNKYISFNMRKGMDDFYSQILILANFSSTHRRN